MAKVTLGVVAKVTLKVVVVKVTLGVVVAKVTLGVVVMLELVVEVTLGVVVVKVTLGVVVVKVTLGVVVVAKVQWTERDPCARSPLGFAGSTQEASGLWSCCDYYLSTIGRLC